MAPRPESQNNEGATMGKKYELIEVESGRKSELEARSGTLGLIDKLLGSVPPGTAIFDGPARCDPATGMESFLPLDDSIAIIVNSLQIQVSQI